MIGKVVFNGIKFIRECKEDKINAYAAQTAFFMLLSIIPFLMLFLSLMKYTPVTESMLLALYEEGLPGYISPFFITITDEIYGRNIGITAVSAIVAVWSAAKGIQYLTDGLNSVNDLDENRNWFILRLWAVVYTVVFLVVILFTLLVMVFGNSIRTLALDYLPILQGFAVVLASLKGLFTFMVLVVFFDVIFTYLPNKKLTPASQLPGAVLCALAWNGISLILSVYIDYFNGFSMYGSLTTIALLMLWLYFCIYSMLICAEFNVTFAGHLKKWVNRHRKI